MSVALGVPILHVLWLPAAIGCLLALGLLDVPFRSFLTPDSVRIACEACCECPDGGHWRSCRLGANRF